MEDKSSTFSRDANSQSQSLGKNAPDKLKIIYENNNYLVIEKEAGITVNRSDTTIGELTLQDLIEASGKVNTEEENSDFQQRSGIVHRLDKETSGIIVIAKNSLSFNVLQKQFKERKVEKSYLALVHGELVPSSGEIIAPVGRLPWNRKRFGVLAGGREAVTKYQVLSILYLVSNGKTESLSLVRLHPKTGRTHQIRVHLKYINHPIFGDSLYSGRKTSREDRRILSRFFLHAERISFFDPETGKKVNYESDLSYELKNLLEKLKLKTDNN